MTKSRVIIDGSVAVVCPPGHPLRLGRRQVARHSRRFIDRQLGPRGRVVSGCVGPGGGRNEMESRALRGVQFGGASQHSDCYCMPDGQVLKQRISSRRVGLRRYTVGVTPHSPGSRSAPWVSPHAPRANPERVAHGAASKGGGCGTPLGCGQHVLWDRHPGWRGVTAADPGLWGETASRLTDVRNFKTCATG
jgi:hypothetical protein